jgi:hypothetical protein
MKRTFKTLFMAGLFALPALSQAADLPGMLSWLDKVKLSGDIRYRHEFISSETSNSAGAKVRIYDRNRHRLRARLGLQVTVNPLVDAYFRLGTSTFASNTNNPGAGDPISTNQDMSGGFTPKPFWLDRAYIDYHPWKFFAARAGKQPVPFESTDLVWDGDLNVEGVAALFTHKMDKNEVYVRAGGFWAGERGASATKHALDQGLFAGQIGGKLAMDKLSCGLAVAYIDYGNVKGNPTLYTPNNGFGNSLTPISGRGAVDSLGYLNDYNIIDVTANFKYKLDKIEPSLVLDFATNSDPKKDAAYDKKLNTSWLAGLNLKFNKLPLDWDFAYNYRVVQKDALLGAYTDSDPAGGGTNFNGHKLALGFNVMTGTRLGFAYFKNIKDSDNKNSSKHFNYDRVQADFEVKF